MPFNEWLEKQYVDTTHGVGGYIVSWYNQQEPYYCPLCLNKEPEVSTCYHCGGLGYIETGRV